MQVQRRWREFPPHLRPKPSSQHRKPFKMRLAQCLIMEILAVPTTFEHYQRPTLVIETGLTETDVKMPAGGSRIAMYVFAWSFHWPRHKNCQLGRRLRPCHSLQICPGGKSPSESTQDKINLAEGIAERLHISFKTTCSFPEVHTWRLTKHKGFDCCNASLRGYFIENGAYIIRCIESSRNNMSKSLTFATVSSFSRSHTD